MKGDLAETMDDGDSNTADTIPLFYIEKCLGHSLCLLE